MSRLVFETLLEWLERYPRVAVATIVEDMGSTPRHSSARMLIAPDGTARFTLGGGRFESIVVAEASRMLAGDERSLLRRYSFTESGPHSFGAVCGGQVSVFFEILERPPRLLVVGAGHCGTALARAAALCGYEVEVVDDRAEILSAMAAPDSVRRVLVRPDYTDLRLPETDEAVALVSRNHAVDALALRRLRASRPAYVGLIGSHAKKKALFSELSREGFTEEDLSRLRMPIGIEIGAETPEEIAISILAEIISVRRRAEAQETATQTATGTGTASGVSQP